MRTISSTTLTLSDESPGSRRPRRVLLTYNAELADYPVGDTFVAAAKRAIRQAGDIVVDVVENRNDPTLGNPWTAEGLARAASSGVRYLDLREHPSTGNGILVALTGFRHGADDRPAPRADDHRSPVERDLDRAIARRMPVGVFLLAETTTVPAPLTFWEGPDTDRQDAFRRRVEQRPDLGTTRVTDPSDLQAQLRRMLTDGTLDRPTSGPSSGSPSDRPADPPAGSTAERPRPPLSPQAWTATAAVALAGSLALGLTLVPSGHDDPGVERTTATAQARVSRVGPLPSPSADAATAPAMTAAQAPAGTTPRPSATITEPVTGQRVPACVPIVTTSTDLPAGTALVTVQGSARTSYSVAAPKGWQSPTTPRWRTVNRLVAAPGTEVVISAYLAPVADVRVGLTGRTHGRWTMAAVPRSWTRLHQVTVIAGAPSSAGC